MALLGEAFTVLAVLEAVDKASEIYERISGALDNFSGTMDRTATVADAAGKAIDDGLLQTASGADAVQLASARVDAASVTLSRALEQQAAAEQALLDVQGKFAGVGQTDAAVMDDMAASAQRLTKATADVAAAQKTMSDATGAQDAVLAASAAAQADTADAAETAGKAAEDSGSKWGDFAATAGKVSLGLGIVAGLAVKSAMNFQSMTTVLETSGGEAASQMSMVRSGILGISTATATGTQELTQGMYMIGSAGYTGQQGLNVLKTAAEGAKAEGADLATVGNALTTVMTNYYGTQLNAAQATQDSTAAMNQMIAIVSNGKTTTEALASSLSAVLPTAKAAGLSFDQVGGAMATMTGEGVSAQQAAQDLAFTIRSLQSPSSVAVNEMTALGLNSQQVSQQLGTKGLTGTLSELTDAIAKNTKGGSVLISTLANAKNATADAQQEINSMPASMQKLAQGFLNGSITSKQWTTDIQGAPEKLKTLMTQFASTAGKMNSFNSLLTSGSPAAQTYTTALDKMMGGATGLTTALDLTGTHALKFNQNVQAVSKAAGTAKDGVAGWSEVTSTMSFKLSQAKEAVENTGIAIGTALLPAVTKVMDAIMDVLKPISEWIEGHQKLSGVILGVVVAITALIGVVGMMVKVFKTVNGIYTDVKTAITKAASALGLFKKSSEEAQAAADEAAVSTETLTTETEANAVASEEAAVATETQAAGWGEIVIAMGAAAIATVAQKVATIATTAATWAATTATTALGAAIDFATGPIGIIVIAIVALIAIFVALWTKCSWFRDFWIDLWNDIVKVAEDVWHAIYSFFTTIISTIISWITGHWRLIITIIGGPLGLVVALVTKYWGDIKQWFMDGVNAVKNIVEWFASLNELFARWLLDAYNAVVHGVDDIVDWFKKLPGEILSLLSDAGSWLTSVGEDIISGLWNGISNALGGLENKVKGMAGDVKNWAKDALSILSPSRVMADEVGKYIPLGIAVGITENLGSVEAATRQAGAAATTGLQSGFGGFSGVGSSSSASQGGGQLYIDLRGSSVMSNQDMDLLVNKIGRSIATRVLPAGGVRINLT